VAEEEQDVSAPALICALILGLLVGGVGVHSILTAETQRHPVTGLALIALAVYVGISALVALGGGV
jgi:hypothetical protein